MAAMERHKEKQKFIILVWSVQLVMVQLRWKIDHELGNLVHIVDVIGYYELNDDRLKNIDFVTLHRRPYNQSWSSDVSLKSTKDRRMTHVSERVSDLKQSDEYFSPECL